ncbi:MAG: hypothetical protein ACI9B7_001344 [Oleispira sp.]|jgi:hypothetical protein
MSHFKLDTRDHNNDKQREFVCTFFIVNTLSIFYPSVYFVNQTVWMEVLHILI